jgi:type III secretion protein L
MDTLFQVDKSLPSPAAGTRILKAADYKEFLKARDIVQTARQKAAEIEKQAEEKYEERLKEGYEDGIEQGKMEHAEKMMETVLASIEFVENIERTVASVVTQSVKKIIGDLDDDERIVRVVHTALNTVRGQQKVTVRVAVADEPAVSKALEAMMNGNYVTVAADSRMERGRCILESDLGVVDASLQTQLAALEHSIQAKIQE